VLLSSKHDGRQPCPGRFVIKPQAHQRHRLDDSQAVFQAPPQQRAIPGWHQNSGAAEGFCRSDQRLHVQIGLSRRMAEEREFCGVSGNSASAFHYGSRALFNVVRQTGAATETMHSLGQIIAGVQVGPPHLATGNTSICLRRVAFLQALAGDLQKIKEATGWESPPGGAKFLDAHFGIGV
jgi:hypothetical protein